MLRELCAEAFQATLKETNGTFLVFRWAAQVRSFLPSLPLPSFLPSFLRSFLPSPLSFLQREFWQREKEVTARPIESVILDPKQKTVLLNDVDQFLAKVDSTKSY